MTLVRIVMELGTLGGIFLLFVFNIGAANPSVSAASWLDNLYPCEIRTKQSNAHMISDFHWVFNICVL